MARPSFAPRADLVVDGCGILGIVRVAPAETTLVWRGQADHLVAAMRETAVLRMDGRWSVPGFSHTQDADHRGRFLIAYREMICAHMERQAVAA
jgi:hypothetical protein